MFTPEKLEISVNKDKVKEGDKVKVTVVTSGDVDYITVNGQVVTSYKTNKRTGERTWTIDLHAEKEGRMTIKVIAYNAEGVASLVKFQGVTVEAKRNLKSNKNHGLHEGNDEDVSDVRGEIG